MRANTDYGSSLS